MDLGVALTSKLKRLENVFQSFYRLFLNQFSLMSGMKLLQLCACVENFHRNWRTISCSFARLSLSMSDGNCDELFEDLYSVIGT